ncbi:MAG: alpha/beta hydrolase [Lentisphaerales bacterium]|nr:alpha/beta hydrolase [Lentisphaerales bacterium]
MKCLLCLMLLCNFLSAEPVIKTPEPTQTLAIWPDRPLIPGTTNDERKISDLIRITKVERPSLEFYKSDKAKPKAPAVLILPGGGYNILAYNHEGTDIASWLNSFGFHAFVVKYTVPKQRLEALKDVQRAIGIVRSKSSEWGINPEKIGMLGFSAGGHLTAHASTNYKVRAYDKVDKADDLSCRPDFSVLVYPAYLHTKEDPESLPPEIKVDKNTPPAFVIQTMDDWRHVPSAYNYIRALNAVKVPAELHLFGKGGHGYGLGAYKKVEFDWPALCKKWLLGVTK